MISAMVFTKMAYIAISIVAGLVFFYVTSQTAKPETKQQLEEGISLVINFILFIWAGKILLNIDIFVSDPLAILAYPSNANAFYAAVLLLAVNIGYKIWRKNFKAETILSALVPIFLGSAFVYEFIDVAVKDNTLDWGHLGLLLVVLVGFLLIHERQSAVVTAGSILAVWSLGEFALTFLLPYTTLYSYTMSRWFLVLVFIVTMAILIHNKKKVRS